MSWHIKENPTSYAIRNDETTVAYVNKSQGDWQNAEQNAQLIKEAPQMYEALKDLKSIYGNSLKEHIGEKLDKKIVLAINKAEGKI